MMHDESSQRIRTADALPPQRNHQHRPQESGLAHSLIRDYDAVPIICHLIARPTLPEFKERRREKDRDDKCAQLCVAAVITKALALEELEILVLDREFVRFVRFAAVS
jgi:hypothetical protein